MANLDAFTAALAARNQPNAAFNALAKLADDILDLKQFTLMSSDHHRNVACRIFTTHPDEYPVGGEKPVPDNHWTQTVLDRKETFVANSIEEIAAVFPDWELIQSLGLESCLNLPIIIDDTVVGTLNCLNGAGHFTPERVAAANQLKLPGAVAFLLAAQTSGSQT